MKGRRGGERPLRVTHAPVNTAGIPWDNVQALRRRGVDARLIVFERYKLHPEADREIRRPRNFVARQAVQAAALARLLPRTDVFHFYFGLTLVPKRAQFPLLRATRRKSVFHFLGSDIRGKPPEELAYAQRADARIVGSYDATRWVPDAEVIPPGVDLAKLRPIAPPNGDKPVFVHAPSSRARKGTEHFMRACDVLGVELEIVEGLHHGEARRRYERADVVLDQLNAGWYGMLAIEAMALGKPVVTFLHDEATRRTEEAFDTRVPIVRADKDNLVEALRPLAASAAERRRIGAESRAYAERVHDVERVADRLLALYARL
ncbi:MAG TPA: glycosyltransferase [Gaiellaceae bacterium]|nr:glycosyltransferase [Gaiellaceae bacterium]